jgi:hypothetical protein
MEKQATRADFAETVAEKALLRADSTRHQSQETNIMIFERIFIEVPMKIVFK